MSLHRYLLLASEVTATDVELLIGKGANTVYTAQGRPFPVSVIEKEIRR